MKRAGVTEKRTSLALISAFLILFVTSIPTAAFADAMTSQTAQLLPPGQQNTCIQPNVSDLRSYVYDGELNSFSFTISDPSYVAVLGQVGGQSIPFKFMTRSIDQNGRLKIHVDIPSTPVRGNLPLSVTLLSATAGKTCATVVAISIGDSVTPPVVTPPTTGVGSGTGSQTPTRPTTPTTSTGGKTTTPGKTTGKTTGKTDGQTATTGSTTSTSTVRGAVQGTLDKICTTSGGAVRLWTVLLAVYLLIIAATILAQPPVAPNAQSAGLLALAIIVPLLVLLGIWYFSTACRVGVWIPIVSLLIAIAGFLLGFRNHPRIANLFSLPK